MLDTLFRITGILVWICIIISLLICLLYELFRLFLSVRFSCIMEYHLIRIRAPEKFSIKTFLKRVWFLYKNGHTKFVYVFKKDGKEVYWWPWYKPDDNLHTDEEDET